MRRSAPWFSWLVLVLGCARVQQGDVAEQRAQRPSTVLPAATPPPLYGPEAAIRDALSGPLEYVGTGKWPGIRRMFACAFRNQRVLVVDVYCGLSDRQALRFDIYSPTRGRARIYAESRGAVSTKRAKDYFTFMVESEPAPDARAGLPPLTLATSFAELRDYEERRYAAFLPVCFTGREHEKERSGCLGPLEKLARDWTAQNRLFTQQASADWYGLVQDLRALANRYGREPE